MLVYLLLYAATTGKEMRQCREEKHASTIPTILRCFEHPSGYLNSKDIIHHVQMQITLKKFRDNRLPCWIFEVRCVTLGISSKSWWSDFSNEHFLLMQRTRWSAWLRTFSPTNWNTWVKWSHEIFEWDCCLFQPGNEGKLKCVIFSAIVVPSQVRMKVAIQHHMTLQTLI